MLQAIFHFWRALVTFKNNLVVLQQRTDLRLRELMEVSRQFHTHLFSSHY